MGAPKTTDIIEDSKVDSTDVKLEEFCYLSRVWFMGSNTIIKDIEKLGIDGTSTFISHKIDTLELTFKFDSLATFGKNFILPMGFKYIPSSDLLAESHGGIIPDLPSTSTDVDPAPSTPVGGMVPSSSWNKLPGIFTSEDYHSNLIKISTPPLPWSTENINFVSENYEELASNSLTNERVLPNLYAVSLLENSHFTSDPEDDFDDTFPSIDVNADGGRLKLSDKESYISKYVDVYNTAETEKTSLIDIENNNIMFPGQEAKNIYDIGNVNSQNLPYTVNLNFQTDDSFIENGVSYTLFSQHRDLSWNTILLNAKQSGEVIPQTLNKKDSVLQSKSRAALESVYFDPPGSAFHHVQENVYVKNAITSNLQSLIWNDTQDLPNITLDKLNALVKNAYDGGISSIPETDSAFMSKPNLTNCKKAIGTSTIGQVSIDPETIVEEEFLSYREIYTNDKFASHEIYCYKIEKFKASDLTVPVQTFWIPNTNSTEIVGFWDSQVKYDTAYHYKINAIVFSYGTKYKFNMFPQASQMEVLSGGEYKYKVYMEVLAFKEINVYEIPGLGTFEAKLVASPPMFPEVNLVPYRNVDNKILISLNKGLGRIIDNSAAGYKVLDEALERSYADSLSEAAALEGVETKDLEIDYSLETPIKGYVVYKIKDRPPLSYSDFDGQISKILTNNSYSDSMEMVDDIEFNVDYYYAFKSFDAFGSYSYPTAVYKLRMVKDSNSVYPLISIHQMAPLESRETTKTFKKLINIKPNIAQSAINYIESDIGAKNIKLGNLEEGLFGQKFKIRIRSKQTGKEIDLNIDFNNTVIDKTT